ncbi:hypothetical protein L6E12_31195 [Actinokineospora sp. PR83]|uniref:hypothetical protein n=1 Tax=Actinokineospora sp. PR83 TaxID=2884908 RepID=UPI001F19C8B6|nr:hypothetical protein [Actinokineospora sp. PR83]MCG8920245.1 hypothetical protein [Actinokineospora sp. PR83]
MPGRPARRRLPLVLGLLLGSVLITPLLAVTFDLGRWERVILISLVTSATAALITYKGRLGSKP